MATVNEAFVLPSAALFRSTCHRTHCYSAFDVVNRRIPSRRGKTVEKQGQREKGKKEGFCGTSAATGLLLSTVKRPCTRVAVTKGPILEQQ